VTGVFERFTQSARAVVKGAVGEAERRGDGYVGSEHLLLGVALAPSAAVRHAFGQQLLVDDLRAGLTTVDLTALEAVGVSLEVGIPAGVFPPGRRRKQHLPFTAGAKQVLANALEEAVTLGHRHIGPEHILLGIARRPPTDPAIRILQHVGNTPETLHGNVVTFLRRSA
jgi:ATP-dependent Clp protease ATP-binding subunit ClpC